MGQKTAIRPECSDRTQDGVTLIEAVIASFLSAVILVMFYGSATSVSTMTMKNNSEMMSEAKQRDVLDNIRAELEQSGMNGRFTVAIDILDTTSAKFRVFWI